MRSRNGNLGCRHVIAGKVDIDRQHIARADVASRVAGLRAELILSHVQRLAIDAATCCSTEPYGWPATFTGTLLSSVVPLPSWPSRLSPQQ